MKQGNKVAPHNYVRKLAQLTRTGALPRDTGLHLVTICHDDWCGIWQQARCNCDPDIRLKATVPGSDELGEHSPTRGALSTNKVFGSDVPR